MQEYDIVVIGSGPGGYTGAIRAAQLGYKVAIVEKYDVLGGTCTNVGCIPSKALLDATEHFHTATHKFEKFGIEGGLVKINFEQLINRKADVVKQNTSGLNFLMKKNKIEVLKGVGSFVNKNEIKVEDDGKETRVKAKYFIIATGSKPATLPGIEIDKKKVITSTEALSLKTLPKTMVIIGGGIIGVEMGSVYSRIGVEVTILEYMDTLIPGMDHDLGKELAKVLKKSGITIHLKSKVTGVKYKKNNVVTTFEDTDGQAHNIEAEYCLVATGRRPYTEGLHLENAGIKATDRGFVPVNDTFQTSVPHIYAIGDVIGGVMLAHKAEDEAVFVAESINGQKPHINYRLIPGVVYTWPEVAGVGYTEEELIKEGKEYRKGTFPFVASGRARAAMEQDGFVKVLSDPKYGEILGVHIIGPRAADLIGQAVLGMEYEVTDEDMFRISYAHPTYSEALKEAYLNASGQGSLNL